jgi:hypothetical protein
VCLAGLAGLAYVVAEMRVHVCSMYYTVYIVKSEVRAGLAFMACFR